MTTTTPTAEQSRARRGRTAGACASLIIAAGVGYASLAAHALEGGAPEHLRASALTVAIAAAGAAARSYLSLYPAGRARLWRILRVGAVFLALWAFLWMINPAALAAFGPVVTGVGGVLSLAAVVLQDWITGDNSQP